MKNLVNILTLFLLIIPGSYTLAQNQLLFPDYDEIQHYHYEISDSMIYVLFRSRKDPLSGTKSSEYLLRPIANDAHQKLPKKLKKYGYKMTKISPNLYESIDSIFIQRPDPRISSIEECLPVYRDILIFKKIKQLRELHSCVFLAINSSLLVTQ